MMNRTDQYTMRHFSRPNIRAPVNWNVLMSDGKYYHKISNRTFQIENIDVCKQIEDYKFYMRYEGKDIEIQAVDIGSELEYFKNMFPEFPYISNKIALESYQIAKESAAKITELEKNVAMLMGHVETLMLMTGQRSLTDAPLDKPNIFDNA